MILEGGCHETPTFDNPSRIQRWNRRLVHSPQTEHLVSFLAPAIRQPLPHNSANQQDWRRRTCHDRGPSNSHPQAGRALVALLRHGRRRSRFHHVRNALVDHASLNFVAPNASSRPSQSFTTNSREFHGISPSPRTNSTPFAAYSA